jgi:hypothetical protein
MIQVPVASESVFPDLVPKPRHLYPTATLRSPPGTEFSFFKNPSDQPLPIFLVLMTRSSSNPVQSRLWPSPLTLSLPVLSPVSCGLHLHCCPDSPLHSVLHTLFCPGLLCSILATDTGAQVPNSLASSSVSSPVSAAG